MDKFNVNGNIIDIEARRMRPGTVHVEDGRIAALSFDTAVAAERTILPGFIDAHVHVESSMLIPSEFARLAVRHGTVATVSDPHEIGNVLGIDGVRYMIRNGKRVPFKFFFGAPSCVPATAFETAGAEITAADIRRLFEEDGLLYLSEMMNFPGVLANDGVVREKLAIAKELGRQIDGHAPGLRGEDAGRYIISGPSTDHECFSLDEALDKLRFGMKIAIREGSAAKNFEALHSLISSHPGQVFLCSDDKHPNDLVNGHINELVKRALAKGHNFYDVLQCACVNPVKHYGLDVGLLQPGDPADFIVVDNPQDLRILETYTNGQLVAREGTSLIPSVHEAELNNFNAQPLRAEELAVKATGTSLRLIEALEGQLITNQVRDTARIVAGHAVADPSRDILKLVVVNRYQPAAPAIAFIKNFGLKRGAIASSVAHDSHNIIAVGVEDQDICAAVNALVAARGGVAVADRGAIDLLPLPVAGIMSAGDAFSVAEEYTRLDRRAKELGSTLHAPFMTLSFMALLVIPALKLSDRGLFDGDRFEIVNVFEEE